MLTPNRLEKVEHFYKRFLEDAILHDLEIMVKHEGGLNFQIASAIITASDLLGKLYLGEKSNHAIEVFIKEFFPVEYENHATIIGDFFRNGLVHVAYTPRGTGVSRGRPELHLKVRQTPEGYAYLIDSDKFYEDFKTALSEYFERVKQDEKVLENFETFLGQIERTFFEELKPKFKESTEHTAAISNATYYPYPVHFDLDEDSHSPKE